ncbi:MAG: SLC26A/SulP transporter family protein [Bradyrhizobium sp.]|nr:SLC26A/SulP transporter family protein [Bradyrhizobium sp.]
MRESGNGRAGTPLNARTQTLGAARNILKDAIAGLLASVVLIANIVSFGALMFPGDLSSGIPIAIWAMLIGGCIGGACIALTTSLPPIATGIDSPTGAVLILLSAMTASDVRGAGGSPEAAIQTVMLVFTAATFLSGALFCCLGAFRWGSYFRFVPYPVVGGFLAAAGYFLIAGAVRMATSRRALTLVSLSDWTTTDTAKLASAMVVFGVLLSLRRLVKSPLSMPAALIAMWLVGATTLRSLGLSGVEHGWYFHSLGTLIAWSPLRVARTSHLTWPMLVQIVPELLAVTIVALISLVTKVSSLEIIRQTAGDIDREFRGHGIASLIAAPFGGLASTLQPSSSCLLEHAGGATRMSGLASALALGLVGLTNFDLPGLIPIPIVAGLVLSLGYTFIVDALWRPYSQRSWRDLLLTVAIMIVCIKYGYLIGVLAGIVCACLLFAISYARLGVVRRHLTSAQFASRVDRSPEARQHLREVGDAIQLYWLSGYIFFGSSEGVFERIRADIETVLPRRVTYVILNFEAVSGTDSSAYVSLAKLGNYCRQQGTTIIYCSLSRATRAALERSGVISGKSQHRAFPNLNAALAWCEDRLLAESNVVIDAEVGGFAPWLQRQIGANVNPADLIAYFERKDLDGSVVLHRQGEVADTIDLVAAGRLAIDLATGRDENVHLRRIMMHTVVGEMGFFRRSLRSATVSSEGPATIFALTRANFERMQRERPDLANAFYDFVVRTLSDRVESANREAAAMESLIS